MLSIYLNRDDYFIRRQVRKFQLKDQFTVDLIQQPQVFIQETWSQQLIYSDCNKLDLLQSLLKLQERDQLDINLINTNAKKIQYQIENIFQNMANLKQIESKLITFDNSKIYEQENLIEFISNVGRKFRVNSLIAKDHIKQRLVDPNNGLSLTELFYTILQSYDFAYLSENFDCTLQIGGSDQWGNITNGCDFVKKQYKKQLTLRGNALFLDQQLTTPNDIRQYIINLPDQSIENYLYMLTLLDEEQIKQHMQQHITSPNLRIAQNLLADQLLLIIHNTNEKYKILFQTKFQTIQAFDNQQMAQFMNNLDSDIIFRFKQDNRRLIELLTETKLQKSKTEIRKLAQEESLIVRIRLAYLNKQSAS
ncbi:hypothetical protein pb186bvf_013829 [Paramecium bursaria]